jgi:hypothetical protein
MFGANFVKHLAGRPHPSSLYVFEALPDIFGNPGFRRQIQEILIGSGVLDDGFGFPVDGEDNGPLGFLKVLHEPRRIATEGRHGLDVFGNVE